MGEDPGERVPGVLGHFDEGRTAEDEAEVGLGSAGGGVEEEGAGFVGVVFVPGLVFKAGQIALARLFDGVFASEDVAGAGPGGHVVEVIPVGGVGGHGG